jgi:SAM-dependent methyltransferase
MWSAAAESYDAWFDGPWGRYASEVEANAVLAAAGALAGRRVLDVGCGTGRFTLRLAQSAAMIVGVEPDAGMLPLAARRIPGLVVRADGLSLPFPAASFDVAVAVTVCEFASDPAELTGELARVTRPGGRIVVGALNRRSPWGWANRSQFGEPPWSTARFLTGNDLRALGEPHGHVSLRHSLFAPRALPGLARWGPLLEHVGSTIAPELGAFCVMTIERAAP